MTDVNSMNMGNFICFVSQPAEQCLAYNKLTNNLLDGELDVLILRPEGKKVSVGG